MTLTKFSLLESFDGNELVESRRGPFCLVAHTEREIASARAEGEKIGMLQSVQEIMSFRMNTKNMSAEYLAALDDAVSQIEDLIDRSEREDAR